MIKAASEKNRLKLEFFKQVFENCEHVRLLRVQFDGYRSHWTSDEIMDVLGLIGHNLLSKLTMLSISDFPFPPISPHINSNAFTILLPFYDRELYQQTTKILLTNHYVPKRNPQLFVTHYSEDSLDLTTLIHQYTKEFEASYTEDTRETVFTSSEFPHCPQFTHFTVCSYRIDDSVPSTFTKAVTEGKFPNLKRIELRRCTLSNECGWPEVPEFSVEIQSLSDIPQMQKLILKLTELTILITETLDIISIIPARAEKLSVLRLQVTCVDSLQSLNKLLKQGYFPNLSELAISGFAKTRKNTLNSFFEEFDPNHAAKLDKLALEYFTISTGELDILSDKLTSFQLTELKISSHHISGIISALFTHSFPVLNVLTLENCYLNSEDIQSMALVKAEGKLPQLKYLNISWNDNIDIRDLFAHSAQWNQLKTLATSDFNVLNVDPELLTSLEELHLTLTKTKEPVTRCWSSLKVIRLSSERGLCCIADGVERGMFPSLTTVRITYPAFVTIQSRHCSNCAMQIFLLSNGDTRVFPEVDHSANTCQNCIG